MLHAALLALALALAGGTPYLGVLRHAVPAGWTAVAQDAGNHADPDGWAVDGDAGTNLDPDGWTVDGDAGNSADPNG